jgi:hypothetical protein
MEHDRTLIPDLLDRYELVAPESSWPPLARLEQLLTSPQEGLDTLSILGEARGLIAEALRRDDFRRPGGRELALRYARWVAARVRDPLGRLACLERPRGGVEPHGLRRCADVLAELFDSPEGPSPVALALLEDLVELHRRIDGSCLDYWTYLETSWYLRMPTRCLGDTYWAWLVQSCDFEGAAAVARESGLRWYRSFPREELHSRVLPTLAEVIVEEAARRGLSVDLHSVFNIRADAEFPSAAEVLEALAPHAEQILQEELAELERREPYVQAFDRVMPGPVEEELLCIGASWVEEHRAELCDVGQLSAPRRRELVRLAVGMSLDDLEDWQDWDRLDRCGVTRILAHRMVESGVLRQEELIGLQEEMSRVPDHGLSTRKILVRLLGLMSAAGVEFDPAAHPGLRSRWWDGEHLRGWGYLYILREVLGRDPEVAVKMLPDYANPRVAGHFGLLEFLRGQTGVPLRFGFRSAEDWLRDLGVQSPR